MLGSFSHSRRPSCDRPGRLYRGFGAALNLRTTSYGTSLPVDVPLIQVDDVLRTNIGRWYHADVAVVADARSAAEQLLEALPERAPRTSRCIPRRSGASWRTSISRANSSLRTPRARWMRARCAHGARSPAAAASQRLLRRRQFAADRRLSLGARVRPTSRWRATSRRSGWDLAQRWDSPSARPDEVDRALRRRRRAS